MKQPSIDELFNCTDEVDKSEACAIEKSTTQNTRKSFRAGVKRGSEGNIYDVSSRKRLKYRDNVNIDELQNRIVVHCLQSLESCLHEVVYTSNQEHLKLLTNASTPARIYPFKLESFQKESILCIDNNQSVLVSAHASAGKNVVAEYAIAFSLKKHQRVVYTTSTIALSNQKYREFREEFSDVGLITGDVSINPNASCLVMTTEILRNMLYRGSKCTQKLGWIICDEIHCMRDDECGVIWEETIILSPHNARFVFLSEKITNARQFAEWIVCIHQQPCHVVYTNYRSLPLQCYIFPAGSQKIFMISGSDKIFKEDNYNKAMLALQFAGETRPEQIFSKDLQSEIEQIILLIMGNNFSPAIVFNFNKDICETCAQLISKLDLNTIKEKKLVIKVFKNAINTLSTKDQNLPQLLDMLPLLCKGIGVHHSGLFPILKEIIEIMFRDGLIKVLFAAETFSMGLNVLARTVVFTSRKKIDESTYHYITPREYVHMSGRAGRRGVDSNGTVILMIDERIPLNLAHEICNEEAGLLKSTFHLTYNMILNSLRVEEINPEYMLKRSFVQFQSQVSLAVYQNQHEYQQKLAEYNSFVIEHEHLIASYYNLQKEWKTLTLEFGLFNTIPNYLTRALTTGLLVKLKMGTIESDWGVVLNTQNVRKSVSSNDKVKTFKDAETQINVLLKTGVSNLVGNRKDPFAMVFPGNQCASAHIKTFPAQAITKISTVQVRDIPNNIFQMKPGNKLYILTAMLKDFKLTDRPVKTLNELLKITETNYLNAEKKKQNLEKEMREHPMIKNPMLKPLFLKYQNKNICKKELEIAGQKLAESKAILHLNELICRKRVLKQLGYCDNEDVIQLKGRVGCELSCCDEILLTEMIFNGNFENLTPKQCCSLLSCFVCEEKFRLSFGRVSLNRQEDLAEPLRQMQVLARKVAKVSKEAAAMVLEEYFYVEQFKPNLMEVIYAWCNGATFSNLCELTDISESSLIRHIKRLDELLRQMAQASKTFGSSQLEEKFLEANKLIRRDIIFTKSLYL